MQYTTLFLTALLGLASAAPAAEPRADVPKDITIQSVKYAGSGCPAGSVASTLSNDKTLLTLAFDTYVAQSGQGIKTAENRKNCNLILQLKYPSGYQYSLFTADYRGFASIGAGSTGTVKSTYFFSGDQSQASLETTFKGPFEDDYLKTDRLAVESLVWSPCGAEGILNLNSQVRVSPKTPTSPNQLTVDTTSLKFKNVFGVQWRKC